MKNLRIKIIFLIFIFIATIFSKTSFADSGLVQINSHGKHYEIPYIIYNPEGFRLGYDSRIDKDYEEFSGGYGTTGLGCNECEDSTPYSHESMFHLADGTYTVKVIGEGLTTYYLTVAISTQNAIKPFDIEGVIDKGMTSKFELTYYSDLSRPWALTRAATPGSLRQDIELLRKIGWIDNDGIVNSLLKKVNAAEKSMEFARTTKTAENQLKALMNEVRAQSGKHIDEKAATILIEDAEYLIDHL